MDTNIHKDDLPITAEAARDMGRALRPRVDALLKRLDGFSEQSARLLKEHTAVERLYDGAVVACGRSPVGPIFGRCLDGILRVAQPEAKRILDTVRANAERLSKYEAMDERALVLALSPADYPVRQLHAARAEAARAAMVATIERMEVAGVEFHIGASGVEFGIPRGVEISTGTRTYFAANRALAEELVRARSGKKTVVL